MTTYKEILSSAKCKKCGNNDFKKFTIIWNMKGKINHMNQDDIDKLPSVLKQLWKCKDLKEEEIKERKDIKKDEKQRYYIICLECKTLYDVGELKIIRPEDFLLDKPVWGAS